MPRELRIVRNAADRRAFVRLPAQLLGNNKGWFGQLWRDELKRIDPRHNPSLAKIICEHFLCWDGDKPVGRISVSLDKEYQARWGAQTAHFGFFDADCFDTAKALMQHAEAWAHERGARTLKGPFSHRTTEDAGFLIEGHNLPARLTQTWSPPEYAAWLEDLGYALDFTMCSWAYTHETTPDVIAAADAKAKQTIARLSPDFSIDRPTAPYDDALFDDIAQVFNETFRENKDIVPLDARALKFNVASLAPLMKFWPDHIILIRHNGRPCAFLVCVPDFAHLLRSARGRLSPWALIRLPFLLRRIDTMVVALIGTLPGRLYAGLGRVLAYEMARLKEAHGYKHLETMWIDDRNGASQALSATRGLSPIKKFGVYQRALTLAAPVMNTDFEESYAI